MVGNMMETAESPESQIPDDSGVPRQPARARRSPPSAARPADRPDHPPMPNEPAPDEPAPLQNRPPPDWSGPQPEFEDEEPGAYLVELGVRGWNVGWAVMNLAITLWIGLQGSVVGISAEWRFLAEVAWKMLPLSGVLLVLITLWQKATTYTRNSPGKSRWTLVLSLISFVLWLILGGEITP